MACNVAHQVGIARNELPDLVRTWFGPAAGRPGTTFRVRFFRSPDGWCVEPQGQVVELPARGRIVAFPTLRAAAGAPGAALAEAPGAEEVVLPVRTRSEGSFAVRATGDSMEGGTDPVRDGDWLVFRYARGVGLGAVEGRVALLQVEESSGDNVYQVKRVVNEDGRWRLRSDNPERASFDANARTVPIALLVERLSPEALAPEVGERIEEGHVGERFEVDEEPETGRVGGHLFILVDHPGMLVAPNRLKANVPDRRPGETAFILARTAKGAWRYCGVGRWNEPDGSWDIPYVDFPTWKALGHGRDSSRRLSAHDLARAGETAKSIVERFAGRWPEQDGKRCRVVGRASQGGVRIDGGPDGFRERTVSLTDIGWVLVARQDVASSGGVLDEPRVNRLRYLEGTPRAATRWIDTGWAILLTSVNQWRDT
jgi:SOS-response transcriptional repressor LexA